MTTTITWTINKSSAIETKPQSGLFRPAGAFVKMSGLNRVTRILQLHIQSQLKTNLTIVTWSRGFCTKTNDGLSEGPVHILQQKISAGELQADEHQSQVMSELQSLYDSIQAYTPPEIASQSSLLKWLPIKRNKSTKVNSPKGLYICGSVGGGKTTLMDLFYNSCHSVSATVLCHWHAVR